MSIDRELFKIHFNKNKDKALETLLGILFGINADKNLNDLEILFLSVWLSENQFLKQDPDCIDLLDCIKDIHLSKNTTKEQIEDLKELTKQIYENRINIDLNKNLNTQSNILLGIVQGIMADKKLLDSEIKSLKIWLENSELNEWPASAIKSRINDFLSDGFISDSEREELINLLAKCGAPQFIETGSTENTTITLGTTKPDSIIFENKNFCFTGTFIRGNRKTCEQLTIDRGGFAVSSVTKKLNYLVLGTHPTRDWITSSYGLKIKKAMDLKNDGAQIILITEETWESSL